MLDEMTQRNVSKSCHIFGIHMKTHLFFKLAIFYFFSLINALPFHNTIQFSNEKIYWWKLMWADFDIELP